MKILVLLLSFTIVNFLTAQDYKSSLGLRYSNSSSFGGPAVTYKHFLSDNNAIEANFAFGKPIAVGGVYQIYKPLNTNGLRGYFGAGAFASFESGNTGTGIIGNAGLDYKFPTIPINLSLDFRPELNLGTKSNLDVTTFGFSIRYVIQ